MATIPATLATWLRSRFRPTPALGIALAILLLAGCGGGDGASSTPTGATKLAPRAGVPIDVGGTPVAIAADGSGVWVADNSGAVLRLDPEQPESAPERIPAGGGPSSIAIGEGAVWVAGGDGSITRIEPADGETAKLGLHVTQPGGIVAGEGSIWVTSSAANALVRIDPATMEPVGDPIDVGEFPTDVAVGDGSVWVANTNDGTVTRVEAASGEADEPIEVADGQVSALAVGEGGVWVTKSDDQFGDEVEVVRIDPGQGSPAGEPAAVDAGIPVRIAAGEGGVWTTLVGGSQPGNEGKPGTVALVDPATGTADPNDLPVGERPSGIATGAGAVWVAGAGDGTVTRISPHP